MPGSIWTVRHRQGLLTATVVLALFIAAALGAASASPACHSLAEARRAFPSAHLYWHGPGHCWDNNNAHTSGQRSELVATIRSEVPMPAQRLADLPTVLLIHPYGDQTHPTCCGPSPVNGVDPVPISANIYGQITAEQGIDDQIPVVQIGAGKIWRENEYNVLDAQADERASIGQAAVFESNWHQKFRVAEIFIALIFAAVIGYVSSRAFLRNDLPLKITAGFRRPLWADYPRQQIAEMPRHARTRWRISRAGGRG